MSQDSNIMEFEERLDRAQGILKEKIAGLPEEARRIYKESTASLKVAVRDNPKSFPLLLLHARVYFERAQAAREHKLESLEQGEKFLIKAQKKVEEAYSLKDRDESAIILWAKILIHIAEYTTSLKENEYYMVVASEKLLLATDLQQPHKDVYNLLERASQVLINGSKERLREGKAVFHLAGEFTKQGGGHKSLNWKNRWFVVTDTSVSYYKDKKTWESGPVQGQPIQPQGIVEFSEVTTVTTHGLKCSVEKKPKNLDKTHCLHIVTPERTYNILGFDTQELCNKWLSTIQFAVKCYEVKRKAKKWLKDTTYSSLRCVEPGEEESRQKQQ